MTDEIKRDLGSSFILHSGHPDLETIRLQFAARFGFEPERIFEELGYTWVGPAPSKVDLLDFDGEV